MEQNNFNIHELIQEIKNHILNSNIENNEDLAYEFEKSVFDYIDSFSSIRDYNKQEYNKSILESYQTYFPYIKANPQGLSLLLTVYELMIQPFEIINKNIELLKDIPEIERVILYESDITIRENQQLYSIDLNEFENIGESIFGSEFRITDFISIQ